MGWVVMRDSSGRIINKSENAPDQVIGFEKKSVVELPMYATDVVYSPSIKRPDAITRSSGVFEKTTLPTTQGELASCVRMWKRQGLSESEIELNIERYSVLLKKERR